MVRILLTLLSLITAHGRGRAVLAGPAGVLSPGSGLLPPASAGPRQGLSLAPRPRPPLAPLRPAPRQAPLPDPPRGRPRPRPFPLGGHAGGACARGSSQGRCSCSRA